MVVVFVSLLMRGYVICFATSSNNKRVSHSQEKKRSSTEKRYMLSLYRVVSDVRPSALGDAVRELSEEVALRRGAGGDQVAAPPPQQPHAQSSAARRQPSRRTRDEDDDAAAPAAPPPSSAMPLGGGGGRASRCQPCDECFVDVVCRLDASSRLFATSSRQLYELARAAQASELAAALDQRRNTTALGRLTSLPSAQRLPHTHASRVHFFVEWIGATRGSEQQQRQTQQQSRRGASVDLVGSGGGGGGATEARLVHIFRTLQAWLHTVPRSRVLPPCPHAVALAAAADPTATPPSIAPPVGGSTPPAAVAAMAAADLGAASLTLIAESDYEARPSWSGTASAAFHRRAAAPTRSVAGPGGLTSEDAKCQAFADRCTAAADQIGRWLASRTTAAASTATAADDCGGVLVLTNETFVNGRAVPRWMPLPLLPGDVIDVLAAPIVEEVALAGDVITTMVAMPRGGGGGGGGGCSPRSAVMAITPRSKNRDALPRFVVAARARSPGESPWSSDRRRSRRATSASLPPGAS